MSGPYYANIVNLSSGQILFADPTKPWSPDHFPTMPSTTLGIGVVGRIEDGNFQQLAFTNTIAYAPFEPLDARAALKKPLQISADGTVTYADPQVGYVSTVLQAQSTAVASFTSAEIGGSGIQAYGTASPDTVTNALAKLDAWIANAFLVQPPAVVPVQQESTAFYGGVRWTNFRTFSALDKSFPYVDSIVFLLGDPETGNYCTFELGDSDYFPYKNYVNGLCPVSTKTPLVRLRIYTDIFIPTATSLYTKAAMQTGCVRLISESGNLRVPSVGKVFALEDTDGSSFYTTVSIFLPNLPLSYPKGTPVPVRIVYMNKTDGAVNIAETSTIQATTGGPSAVSSITYQYASASTLTVQARRPAYSDAIAEIQMPFFSTYTASYAVQGLHTAHPSGVGFAYGVPNTQTLPTALEPYVTSASIEVPYMASIQNINIPNLAPGALWSASLRATNAAGHVGVETAAPLLSTLFPANPVSTLSAHPLQTRNVDVRTAGTVYLPSYTADTGWSPGATPVGVDVLFLSTVTQLHVGTVAAVQWNAASYPGDRSTIAVHALQNDVEQVAFSASAAASNALPTGTPLTAQTAQARLEVEFQDAYADTDPATAQNFYYKAQIDASYTISDISPAIKTAQLLLDWREITVDGDIIPTTVSSAVYQFCTDACGPAETTGVAYCSISDLQQISGLYTPTSQSKLLVDIYGSNFGAVFLPSTVATVQALLGNDPAGPVAAISTLRIFEGTGAIECTTLPLPQNTLLRLSSCAAQFSNGVWQDPNDPLDFAIVATLLPANPVSVPAPFLSTITPTIYIDTVSDTQKFNTRTGPGGQRVSALLPRTDISITFTQIRDGILPSGASDIGLDVSISSLYTLQPADLTLSAAALYSHTSSLSTVYTSPYSRELLFMNGLYMHPAGSVFSVFNGSYLGVSDAVYPDFVYDLASDMNHGYRYATFLYETVLSTPTACQYMYVRIHAPSAVSTIQATRAENNWFPDGPVAGTRLAAAKARLHVKLLGIHNPLTYDPFETAWINCWKVQDMLAYDDGVFDAGAAAGATVLPNGDVEYRIQINRRYYSRVYTLARIGLAQDSSVYSDAPLQFASMSVRFGDGL